MPQISAGHHVSYQGQLLIAAPALNETPFDHSVIYLWPRS
jgi:putative AlgH/UPF0301 family transcriptional regulator